MYRSINTKTNTNDMKNLTTTILLFTALMTSVSLRAQVKASRYNEPYPQVSGAGSETVIIWTTVKEVNSRYFLVETSADSLHFIPAKTVPAAGSSVFARTYREDDIVNDSAVYFRVTLVDMNGARFSSEVIRIPSHVNAVVSK